jgi:hypothetical protein
VRKFTFALLALACACAAARAQNSPAPPNVLVVIREEIKPGEMPAHEQEAIHYVRTLREANKRLTDETRDGRIAMTPVAGNENEVMYLWAYDSFADMERRRDAADKLATGAMRADFERLPDARLHASQRDMIAGYRADLSYNVGGGTPMPRAKYVSVQTVRIKPGHEDEYWAARRRIMHAAYDKMAPGAAPFGYAVYQVRAGAPLSTYMIFRPLKSLADLDTNVAAAARAQMGGDRDDMDKVVDRSILFHDIGYYVINPRLSVVDTGFAAAGTPGFWNPPLPAPPAAAADTRRPAARRNHRR